ncbi:hypothetical protein B7P43_G04675 [Cryptotermes secundus]|uniref:Uncharacterized protein n=1 Tax=Cryptotermes secundus TaxID=105785 RepID=A0A2J7R1P2_9NEOP|nr:hypothetical protein B7P43_G04675 [Cryptotermes secundus]
MEETRLEVNRSSRIRKRPGYLNEYSTVVMTGEYEELISEERNNKVEFAVLTNMPDDGRIDNSSDYEVAMSAIEYCEKCQKAMKR